MQALAKCAVGAASLLLLSSLALGDEIKRSSNPNSTLPLATAVTVPAGATITFFSGTLADVANPDAPKGTVEAYGDTRTQATSILRKFEKLLAAEGYSMADVVKVNVFLVGDPKLDGKMDFAGLNAAYGQFFGTAAQPNKPVRTTLQIVALPMPGGLVEIELTAARVAQK
ncbi:MAG: RidA family protein [Burkholderiaceae bacterium]|nr:RidA family protein [Burkholderiaceae bacterium]